MVAAALALLPAPGRTLDVSPDGPYRTIQSAADAAGPGDTVVVKDGVYREAVRLTRSGNYFGRPIRIVAAPGARPVVDAEGLSAGAAFDTGGQDHLEIRGLTVRNAGGCGFLVGGSYRVRMSDCRSLSSSLSGVLVDKSSDVVLSRFEVTQACLRGGEESVSLKRCADVVFEDSEVHHTMHEGIDAKEGAKHVTVRGNRVHHVERQGLYADAWDADTGYLRFENNVVHDCMVGLVACTESGGLLHDVAFVGNVVYDCRGPGMMLAKWGGREFGHRIRRIAYVGNTVFNCAGQGSNGPWAGGLLLENDQAEDVEIRNNVIARNGYAQLRVTLNLPPQRMRMSGNVLDGVGENLVRGNLVGRVRFADEARRDLRLAPGSAGRGTASAAGLPPKDPFGRPRGKGKTDAGALAPM